MSDPDDPNAGTFSEQAFQRAVTDTPEPVGAASATCEWCAGMGVAASRT